MNINTYIQKYRKVESITPDVTSCRLPHVVCRDGFKMSVQVGKDLYSEPKAVADSYTSVEVGYPSENESLLDSYDYDGGSVFPFVPCTVVDVIIDKHGGIDVESSLVTSLRKGN